MSLSALLLGASRSKKLEESIDSDLDALFRSTASAPGTTASAPLTAHEINKKRKSRREETGDRDAKRAKGREGEPKKIARISDAVNEGHEETSWSNKAKVKEGKRMKAESSEDEHNDSEPENAYTRARVALKKDVADVEVSDEEGDPSQLIHESVTKASSGKGKNSGPTAKSKYAPQNETPEQRDARTIFVGNLSVEVAQKRPLLKQLQRHILSHVPTARIESTRFRSVPFQNPTSKLPTSDDEDSLSKPKKSDAKAESSITPMHGRQHDRDRTALWRADQEESEIKADDKKFLNPKQKKKIAFINREFHSSADSVNAYIVFSHPASVVSRAANVPPPPETMDPYEAARLSMERCDGTLFMERLIRVDIASKNVKVVKGAGDQIGAMDGNPKLSVFVGNLDFGCKEEDLRVFFEGLVSGERGPPEEDKSESKDGAKKPNMWVTRVRIVRDKETQLGKGFAYVQFVDRECVDEVLALDETKLRFAKRKLRVQRYKTLPGGSTASGARPVVGVDSNSLSSPRPRAPAVPIPIPSMPKGDPFLGSKLAHLPKDERKQIKSSDADRIARRLAKKKARNALAKEGLKPQVKDRVRVRKALAAKKGSGSRKESKGRVRSEKTVAKRNMKK